MYVRPGWKDSISEISRDQIKSNSVMKCKITMPTNSKITEQNYDVRL